MELLQCIFFQTKFFYHTRVDVVNNQLGKREKGIHRKVTGNNKLSGKWAEFLHDPTNKQEPLEFLCCKLQTGIVLLIKTVVITSGSSAVIKGSSRSMGLYVTEFWKISHMGA